MSVINTMLKDLGERKAVSERPDDDVLKGLSSSNNERSSGGGERLFFFSLTGMLLLVAIIVMGYIVSPYRLTNTSIVAVDDGAYEAEKKSPVKPSSIKTTQESNVGLVNTAVNNDLEKSPQEPVVLLSKISTKVIEAHEDNHSVSTVQQSQSETVASSSAGNTLQAESIQLSGATDKGELGQIQSDMSNESRTIQLPSDRKPSVAFEKKPPIVSIEQKSQKKYQAALALYQKGETQHASILLSEALKISPVNMEARHFLAVIHLRDGRPDLAKELVSKGLLDQPYNSNLLRLYLQICVQEGRFSEAIVTMESGGLASNPEEKAYLAGLYQKTEDHLKALDLYSQALSSKPKHSVWWMGKGISLEALSKNEEALEAYRVAVSSGGLTTTLKSYVMNRMRIIERLHLSSFTKDALKKYES